MVTYTRKALIAQDTLTPAEQSRVEATVRSLDQPGKNFGRSRTIKKLTLPGEVYIARAGESLRVIFEVTPEGSHILDIVRRERLVQFHRSLVAEADA